MKWETQNRRMIKALRDFIDASEQGYRFPDLRSHCAITLMVMTDTKTLTQARTRKSTKRVQPK